MISDWDCGWSECGLRGWTIRYVVVACAGYFWEGRHLVLACVFPVLAIFESCTFGRSMKIGSEFQDQMLVSSLHA
jgi:hypothetical protein